ncbi:mechanosensitive ion channel [Candidatus Woesearchaeota archaeon]|nr:mechanosensitive ion channel [Candidatus Woesearchaeota archaeon]
MAILIYLKDNIITIAQNLIVAVIIIFIGFILAKTVDRLVYRILHEIELNKLVKKLNIERFISKVLYYIIILATIIMALNQLNVATTVLNVFVAAIAIFGAFLVIVWLKDFIPNAFARILLRKKNFKEGDSIKIPGLGIEGKIKEISLSETKVITKNKEILYVPNSSIYKNY